MKPFKCLLLAAPATIAAAAAGQAADLPANRAAPVSYVRVCDAYGSGFFFIPGTDTCLRVGGYVRFEARIQPGHAINNLGSATVAGAVSQIAGAQDETGIEVRGRIDADARTQTQWGTVQTVVHLRGANADGVYSVGGTTQFLPSYTPAGNKSTVITLERAYIRFAGLTAGVSSENFTTIPSYMYGPGAKTGFPNGIKQLAYTATFGGGFSSTLAIESKGDFGSNAVTAGDGALNGPIPYAYGVTYANRWDSGYALVGNVRYDASWGYLQANGAVKDNTVNAATLGGGGATSVYNPLVGQTGLVGWAAGFSFRYNLPFIAPGDQFHFQFAYAHGFEGLVQSNGSFNNLSNSSGAGRFVGGIQTVPNDIIATSAAGPVVTSIAEPNAYQVYGLFTHYWTPTWRSNVQASYLEYFAPGAALSAGVQEGNAKVFSTAGNLIWSPAKNFDIGVELDYIHLTQTIQNSNLAGQGWVAAGKPGLNENGVSGILRLERQF